MAKVAHSMSLVVCAAWYAVTATHGVVAPNDWERDPHGRARTQTSCPTLCDADAYKPYNKCAGLYHWIKHAKPQAEFVIILDAE